MTGADVRARAVHEAGHVTVASAFGIHIARAHIRDGAGETIACYSGGNVHCWPVVAMGGLAVGDLFGLPTHGARQDVEQVLAAYGRAEMIRAYEAAYGLLECQRPAIEHLADALVEHGGLTW